MPKLYASGAGRWVNCSLSAHFPHDQSTNSVTRIEGLAAHWVAACILNGDASSASDLIDRVSPEGHIITADMAKHVAGYLQLARTGYSRAEHRITFGSHIIGRYDLTNDNGTALEVWDFKYGYTLVEPLNNHALIIYAAAQLKPSHESVTLGIYQPRPWHPEGPRRAWITSPDVIRNAAAFILERAEAAQAVNPAGAPGPHCNRCPGASQCAAFASAGYAVLEAAPLRGNGQMSAAQIGAELTFLRTAHDYIKQRRDAVETELETRMKAGEFISGWTTRPTYGDRRFKVTPEILEMCTGHKCTKLVTLTPAQLEREGVDVDMFTERPYIGDKLVPATSKEFERFFKK